MELTLFTAAYFYIGTAGRDQTLVSRASRIRLKDRFRF